MLWSIPIAVIAGTVVRIHITFLLFLIWIAGTQWRSAGKRRRSTASLFIVLLFACVLAHEFGHIFAARRYGIRTPEVTLWPIGGVASLERIPDKPSEELVVALAGPAVNVVIAPCSSPRGRDPRQRRHDRDGEPARRAHPAARCR